MPTLTITSRARMIQGFKYFWMKRVRGFDPSNHCAKCLVGDYVEQVKILTPVNTRVEIAAMPGEVFYLCGVSHPYKWANNLHLAVESSVGFSAQVRTYAGDLITITDARPIKFDDSEAKRRFPGLSKAFLTCRNFQFGAHRFRE